MPPLNNTENPQHYLLAKLALLAHRGKQPPQGTPPTDEELAQLYDNQLSFQRRQQVMSHINNNPQLFKQWIALVDVLTPKKSTQQNNQAHTFKHLFQTLQQHWQGLLSGAAVTSIILMVILLQPSANLTPSVNTAPSVANIKPNTAIKTASFISPDKRAILAGIKSNNAHKSILPKLNYNNAIGQQGSALKPALYQQYYTLGQLLAELTQQCQNNQAITADTWAKFIKTTHLIKQQSFIPLPKALNNLPRNKPAPQHCQLIQQLLLSGL